MVSFRPIFCLAAFAVLGLLTSNATIVWGQTSTAARVDFNRDVRPILADRCFACHGFDENAREADLRLDTFSGATADQNGPAAIVPGQPSESLVIRRITSLDPDEQMPPPSAHRQPFTAQEIQLLVQWIAQGAEWGEHWAFVKPRKAVVPEGEHAVDFFVKEELSKLNEKPAEIPVSPEADPHTLARRLSFDLLGLPPESKQLANFAQQPSDQQWETLIDELLASPHFGERMAMWWLDGARYSDTDGFQADATRQNWPWRDWVIDAFNDNMPFDQFTIEQFAGDLLPGATDSQRLATCFHRNHMHNGEGGRDAEESRVDYVLDRVNTAGTLWLGLTLGCTQCHDHKFDPISQQDYYSLSAYFNSIAETGAAGGQAKPFLKWKAPTAERDVARNLELKQQVAQQLAERRRVAAPLFESWLLEQQRLIKEGYQCWRPVPIARLATTEGYQLSSSDNRTIVSAPRDLPQDDYIVTCSAPADSRITAIRLDVFPDAAHTDGKLSFSPSGEFILTNFKLRLRRRGSAQYRELEVTGAIADVDGKGKDEKYAGVVGTLDDDPRTGWTTRNHPANQPHWAVFELSEPLVMAENEELDILLMQRSIEDRELIGRFGLSYTDRRGTGIRSRESMSITRMTEELKRTEPMQENELSDALREELYKEFLEDDPPYAELKQRLSLVEQQLKEAQAAAGELNVTVLEELDEPRPTHVLVRGVWDNHGDRVTPGVLPAVLPVDRSLVPTRLELGQWFAAKENPLTARVIVNQIWQLFFGIGLVRSPNDFGLQGELPTHPQLLDWLAVDFMESGWDIKHLIKTIASSQTYRRSSAANRQQMELDPQNRYLARGARFRLPAWMIRDSRLAISGQLNRDVGGPPVFPYQPAGVWEDQFMGRLSYRPTVGNGQYRRTIYAFWRRSSSPAFLFDAPQRRNCEVIPLRTNTPLHALNLLNDLTGQEAARELADQVLAEAANPSQAVDRDDLDWLGWRVLSRHLDDGELDVLERQFIQAEAIYKDQTGAAQKLLTVGQLPAPPPARMADRAALMVVATTLLNLDECITHE